MLGELIAEFSGQLTGTKVLASSGPAPKIEASLQGSGKLLELDATVIGTYWQVIRGQGRLYGEGRVVVMTGDGGVAKWTGFGVGTITGSGFSSSWGVCGHFQTEAASLEPLNDIATVSEYDLDENGNWTWHLSEWKRKAAPQIVDKP